jgi:hypothetical protein
MSDRYNVYAVNERGEDDKGNKRKDFWTRAGTAFPFKDGKDGWTVLLDVLPTNGKLVLVPPKEEEEEQPKKDDKGGSKRR